MLSSFPCTETTTTTIIRVITGKACYSVLITLTFSVSSVVSFPAPLALSVKTKQRLQFPVLLAAKLGKENRKKNGTKPHAVMELSVRRDPGVEIGLGKLPADCVAPLNRLLHIT